MRYILILLFSLSTFVCDAQPGKILSLNVEDLSLTDFISLLEEETGVKIYYSHGEGKDIKISLSADSIMMEEALEIALQGSILKVSGWNGNFVILPHRNLIEKLPDFKSKVNSDDTSGINSLTSTEKRYMQGRKPDVIKTLVIGNKNTPSNGKVRVSGKITDQDTGEPVIGATIYIQETKTGAATDLQGFFTIILPRGKYHAEIASMAYETGKYFFDVYSNGSIKINLKNAPMSLQEVVIKGDRQMDIKKKDPGLEKISVQSIRAIPMLMGEKDIIKVSEMLPGIISVGEGSSGLNVRGGSSDQNAFYINRIPVYNTSHLFGFFPAFNSDIIKDFSIYKGHIPVEYGGRLSSVFNITSRQGNKKDYRFRGGINPFSANLTLEGPVIKEKSSVLMSARSSYSDWILGRINDPDIRNSSANFNDFSLYTDHHLNKTVVSAFIYASNDKFKLSDLNNYNYRNRGASLNLHHNFKNLLRMDLSLIGSRYGFNTIDKQNISTAYEHAYTIDHYELRSDFTKTLNESNELYFGLNAINYQLNRGSLLPFGEESLRLPIHHGIEKGLETGIYIADHYDFSHWLNISAGLRYSFYAPVGNKDVYTYEDNLPKETVHINDTLRFANNKPIKWYKSPELRLALNFQTDPDGSIKLAFNQMSQNLFMLNNTIAIAPNTQWKLTDYHIEPSRSNQFSAGFFRNMASGKIETSVEFFYKKTSNYTEYKDGADFLNNPLIETEILQGDHNSYGAEFLLKKKMGRINGWLAYTYSRSFVQVDGENQWEKINNGKIYPSNYDVPHVINSVLNYNFSKRITLSTVITYQKGRPVTYPVSVYYISNNPTIDYYERNKYRIPDYFRTDVSLSIEGNLKRNKLIHSSWMFSVYNATGRKNAYSVYFISEKEKINSYKYSVIGVPFFTATWLFKFGNYASQ
ncbi:MAG: TonB-dependent receptor [Bacteroidota bacterium]